MYLFAFFSEYTWRSKRRQRNYASLKHNANNRRFNATVQALAHDAFGDSAFSKRFEGEGCSEVGGGLGAAGTQASARRARACRGVWGHPPPGNF